MTSRSRDVDRPHVRAADLAALPVSELLPAIGERPRGRRRRGMLAAWERLLAEPSADGDGTHEDELCRRVREAAEADPHLAVRVWGDTLRAQAEEAANEPDRAEDERPGETVVTLRLGEAVVEPLEPELPEGPA